MAPGSRSQVTMWWGPMTSNRPADPSHDDWLRLLSVLSRLHRQLLTKTEALQAQLEQSSYVWTVGDDVQGYLAPGGPGRFGAAERTELVANLRVDLRTLRRLTARLEQLRALVEGSA